MIPTELILRALQQQGAVPPMGAAQGAGPPAAYPPALARRAPVQPPIPMQGHYGQLAARMAGPSPVTATPGAYNTPTAPPRPQIPQPVPQGPGAMQLPTGLASPQQLLQLLGGRYGY